MIIGSDEVLVIARALDLYATEFRQAALNAINVGDLDRANKNRRIAGRVEDIKREVEVADRLHVVKKGDLVAP